MSKIYPSGAYSLSATVELVCCRALGYYLVMSTKNAAISVLAVALLTVLGVYFWQSGSFNKPSEADARALVQEFGTKLKNVPLTGEEQAVRDAIRKEYSAFLTPELLASFQGEPHDAPGRLMSSPWPEKIEITKVWPIGQAFVVDAEIVYLTSKEVAEGGEAYREKISLAVQKRGPKLLIADYDVVPTE